MTNLGQMLLKELTDPVALFGHFTYFLLLLSVLMRKMTSLRALAVASGIAKIIYRSFFVVDPISVFWESIFVVVNLGQLAIIWYYEHHHRFHEDERHFVESMPVGVERSAINRLLQLARPELREVDTTLTEEGRPVQDLMYVAEGVVQIEKSDRIVAICGPGDYIGELSFVSGTPASATARVVKPVRLLAFDQQKLRALIDSNATLRRALESGLNRNLAGKLVRSNQEDRRDDPVAVVPATASRLD